MLLRRHVFAEVTAPTARDWTVEWTRTSDGSRHGAYSELDDHQPRVVEISVAPRASAPKEPFEFWLYFLKTDGDTKFDLARLTDHGRAKGWVPNDNGPGIIYVGPGPGTLTIPVNTPTIALGYARTPRTGAVTVRFRGEVVTIPTTAATSGSETTVIPGGQRTPPSGTLARRLPTYDTSDVTFACAAAPGDTIQVSDPRVTFTLANHWLFRHTAALEAVSDIQRIDETAWKVTGPRPTLRIQVDDQPGVLSFVVGSLAMFGVLALLSAALYAAIRITPAAFRSRATPTITVALLVLTVHTLVAVCVPTLVTSDGMDYMDAADGLAHGHGFERFPDYKAPGLSILIALAMKLSAHFLDVYAWFTAALAVSTSLAAYHFVRARAPHAWALAAALVVGLHPSLITYEAYLLRELPSAAVMMAVALAIVLLRDRLASGKLPWVLSIILAVLCAVGASLRENLQVLVFLVPIILLLPGAGLLWRRAVAAGAVAVLSASIILPGVLSIQKVYGNLGLVRPKIHYNRALAAQSNRAHEANFSEFFTKEQWLTFRNEHLKRALSDNDLIALLNTSKLAADPSFTGPNKGDQQQRTFMDEATAREPLSFYKASVRAFVSQLGLWNVQTGAMRPVAPSDEYYSKPLRGEPITATTNFPPDTTVAINNARLSPNKDRLQFLITDNRRSIDHLEDRPLTRLFNEWFYASRALRPFAGWLFLIGVVIAIRRRDISIAAVGCIVLLSTFGAAFVVGTPTDRFGVPFIPIIWCVAILALRHLVQLRRSAPAA